MIGYIAVDRGWSVGWLTQLREYVDLGCAPDEYPDTLEHLFEITTTYLYWVHRLTATDRLDGLNHVVWDLINAHHLHDIPADCLLSWWDSLYRQIVPALNNVATLTQIRSLAPVVNEGVLQGIVVDTQQIAFIPVK